MFDANQEKPTPFFVKKKKKRRGDDDENSLESLSVDGEDFHDKFDYIEKKEEKKEVDPNKEIDTPTEMDDDSLLEGDIIDSEVEEGMSQELDEEDSNDNGKVKENTENAIGNKRNREADYDNNREKKQKQDNIENSFLSLLKRMKQLRKVDFLKELMVKGHSDSDINSVLNTLLAKFCVVLSEEKGVAWYVLKNK